MIEKVIKGMNQFYSQTGRRPTHIILSIKARKILQKECNERIAVAFAATGKYLTLEDFLGLKIKDKGS